MKNWKSLGSKHKEQWDVSADYPDPKHIVCFYGIITLRSINTCGYYESGRRQVIKEIWAIISKGAIFRRLEYDLDFIIYSFIVAWLTKIKFLEMVNILHNYMHENHQKSLELKKNAGQGLSLSVIEVYYESTGRKPRDKPRKTKSPKALPKEGKHIQRHFDI